MNSKISLTVTSTAIEIRKSKYLFLGDLGLIVFQFSVNENHAQNL